MGSQKNNGTEKERTVLTLTILPSLFGADIGCIYQEIERLDPLNLTLLHVDMMDGSFVPNIAFGPTQIKQLQVKIPARFDVHMMVYLPDRYIPQLAEAGVTMISIHQEATPHLLRSIQLIKSFGIDAGVVLNPGTPIETLKYVLEEIDYVLLMTVNPGLGGQQFYQPIIQKIIDLKEMIGTRPIKIEVDGGVNQTNIKECFEAGAEMIVVGSYLFDGEPVENYKKLMNACQ